MTNVSCAACLLPLVLFAAGAFAEPMLPGYLTDAGAGEERELGAYKTPDHLKYPYVSTYYVQPTVLAGETVRIGYYVTDWNHSKARTNDDSHRFDVTVRYSRDCTNWTEKVAKNVKTGDGAFDLGSLPVGEWTLSVQAKDLKSGLPSGIVWHDFRVVRPDAVRIRADETYRVTAKDLADYGIMRIERDYERVVLVPADEKLAARRDYKPRAKDGLKAIDAFLATNRHVDAKMPGYAVYTLGHKGVPVNRSYEIARIVRDAGYDTNAVARAATATRKGVQKLVDDKRKAGFRKVTFPKGVYRVDHHAVKVPAGLTLDLGGAVFKLNGFTGCTSFFFTIGSGRDTVLENGTLEGDYWEHDYAHSPNNSEWPCGWRIHSAAWYCEVRDVVTRNITGYGGNNCAECDAPGDWYCYANEKGALKNVYPLESKDGWTAGGFRPDGTYDEKDPARWTSRPIDVTGFIPFKYLSVSKLCGYRGIRTRNWNVTVAYFDAAKKLLGTEVVSQYRVSLLPPGAKTARFSIEVASLAEAQKCDMHVFLMKIPQNGAVRRCRFERCRAVGYAMSDCRNWLVEDCEFLRSGETLATCAFDAEDGWDGMQDVTFRRNWFHDNPNNEFLTCAGHNFVYENNRGKIHLWARTFSPCIRSNDCETAVFDCANRNRTGYGRYDGNTYRKSVSIGPGGVYTDWNIVVRDRQFRREGEKPHFGIKTGGTGLLLNCTFDGIAVSPGAAEKCVFRNCHSGFVMGSYGTWRDCAATNCSFHRVHCTNLYERCSFKNVKFDSLLGGQYFRDCVFDDTNLGAMMPPKGFTGLVTRCTLKGKTVASPLISFAADNLDERTGVKRQ